MFSAWWFALKTSVFRRPPRSRPMTRRLCLEALEERALLSGGLSGGPGPLPTNSGGPGPQPVAVISQGGGTGSSGGSGSGGSGISGPGYPLPPNTAPPLPDPSTLSPTPPIMVLVPLTGTPGGPGPSLAVAPVCTSGGPAPAVTL
jgi:hypothetical protein